MSEPSALAKALAAFQKELPTLGENESSTAFGGYSYASLDVVAAKVLPLLGKHGLSFTCATDVLGEKLYLGYSLLHEGGESRNGTFPLPMSGNPQQIGSWITYARRYALLAITGVHPGGEDDDAAAALGIDGATTTPTAARPARQATKPETAAPETGHVDEKAQVLASLAHELDQRGCTVADLKAKVYDVAKNNSLLNGLVINPFDASMCKLSVVITHARKEAEQRAADAARDQQDGEYQ